MGREGEGRGEEEVRGRERRREGRGERRRNTVAERNVSTYQFLSFIANNARSKITDVKTHARLVVKTEMMTVRFTSRSGLFVVDFVTARAPLVIEKNWLLHFDRNLHALGTEVGGGGREEDGEKEVGEQVDGEYGDDEKAGQDRVFAGHPLVYGVGMVER